MGARADLVHDAGIRSGLLLARRGQAYFLRCLNNLTDEELQRPAPGFEASRALVSARVALRARIIADRLDTLSGVQKESDWDVIDSARAFEEATQFIATLPAAALRHLCTHSGVHLSVSWRDLPVALWEAGIDIAGEPVLVADSPRLRALDVWGGALELGIGRLRDVPIGMRERTAQG